jgi:Cu(I)/Ag(I) efflux system membrane fusion protein
MPIANGAPDKKPLFYRNPMNPSVTSPVPAKDEMGMDYIPVYAEAEQKDKKPLFYRNPMNPAVTSPVPAKDEMGMDYIPVYANDGGDSKAPVGTVKIDPVTVQNIGVRTTKAKRETLSRTLQSVGRVELDETRITRLHPKISGWIESMRVDTTGQPVKKNAILLSIYSPQLVSSQQEYILALSNQETLTKSPYAEIRTGADELVRTARERLQLLDVNEHQIKELEATRKTKKALHIHSPYNGIVMKVGARKGQYVSPKTQLYTIADLSRVWVYVDIYENELPWIRKGDKAELTLASQPGKTFRGRVTYIYPYAESKTRTIKVRLEFKNPGLRLKPKMFANATIHASRQIDAIVVPSEAVIRSGTREQVFIVRAPGKFEPRVVKLGITADGQTQILSGIKAGDEVVTSAQFLIDSESKLREATAKMMDVTESETKQTVGGKVKSKQDPDQQKHGAEHKDAHASHQEMKHD